ncbi:MAG: hypothetical protein E5V72_02200 [Mesorhizobium sp.]|uniref:hypothetical protein n=1 Tax=Mesorhizobium sp. TaxID=1871066 RepID=UPI000FE29DB3|nr:hypothetical protein [Mesorhizobium sp.]RWH50247.1 MAG: hypothetical protein EOQ80_04560 [Mesorhizobium sp.]RWH52287.1 MAG: hypothetical protein EOQ82_26685 [Mesorhizobium sp.]RWI69680.1 MAG: hypothetical protein EOR18_20850 [Mesorhizobium sp.]RWI76147.1 MAG: hypothetical protein EOR19_18440 [Mesorhizobium sp.]RWJ09633.1 MAG: hypothetical protein EOR24_18275 [Mesorhizobium sp.]
MIPHVISGNTISAFVGGDLKTIDSSHPNFDTIKRRLREGGDVGDDLFDLAAALRKHLLYQDDLIRVGYDGLTYNDEPLHNYLTLKIIDLLSRGQPATPWINFLKRLQLNPDVGIKNDLFEWLEKGEMPITPDGYFLAYKKVGEDYLSYHDGKTLNTVGSTIFLPRDQCDPDRFRTCSAGLHFCSWSYLPSYAGRSGHVLVLKINPADVVAFPPDHEAKGRACRYTIIDEVPEDEAQHAFPAPVYSTFYDEDDDDVWGYHASDAGYIKENLYTGIFGKLKAWTKRLLN